MSERRQPPIRLIRGARAGTQDQPKRRVPVTRLILAELDRAPNLPPVLGFDPGPLTGFAVGRTYAELARAIYKTSEPTAAQMNAVQRAAASLDAAGGIDLSRRGHEVVARRIPTEADYEFRAEIERRARERKAARAEAAANAIPYPVDTGDGVQSVMVEPVFVIGADGVEVRQPDDRERERGPHARLARLLAPRGRG